MRGRKGREREREREGEREREIKSVGISGGTTIPGGKMHTSIDYTIESR